MSGGGEESPPAEGGPGIQQTNAIARPEPYLTINPEMLDSDRWSWEALQKLAQLAGVSAEGSRDELVARLASWHRCKEVSSAPSPSPAGEGETGGQSKGAESLLEDVDGTSSSSSSSSSSSAVVTLMGREEGDLERDGRGLSEGERKVGEENGTAAEGEGEGDNGGLQAEKEGEGDLGFSSSSASSGGRFRFSFSALGRLLSGAFAAGASVFFRESSPEGDEREGRRGGPHQKGFFSLRLTEEEEEEEAEQEEEDDRLERMCPGQFVSLRVPLHELPLQRTTSEEGRDSVEVQEGGGLGSVGEQVVAGLGSGEVGGGGDVGGGKMSFSTPNSAALLRELTPF
eukprot:Cvel_34773.t1-p1 / transcript=Cvel_34773.t1 / gene=Cvel_34773 / organism=Chromera_velia_CCMP2878 / gene_product=hypothetical protein / transcript_product=hypothetical protein / location=Cvel_scaffold6082:1613-3431(+) / protein_length=341 / sequence_SO=supercontig / SO=protein_coding / is_pseudo=false